MIFTFFIIMLLYIIIHILCKASPGTSASSMEVLAESTDKPVSLTTYKMPKGQPS